MIVPTGSECAATNTSGPLGTGAAAAVGALPPLIMLRAITAVTAATTSAPISSMSFLTSMTLVASRAACKKQPHTSDKLVKNPFANQPKTGKGDGDSIRYLQRRRTLRQPVRDEHGQGQRTARERHHHQQLHHRERRQPQGDGTEHLDVAAAHHADMEGEGEDREDRERHADVDRHARPQRHAAYPPEWNGPECDRRVEPIGDGAAAPVQHRGHYEAGGEQCDQRPGKSPLHGRSTRRTCFRNRNRHPWPTRPSTAAPSPPRRASPPGRLRTAGGCAGSTGRSRGTRSRAAACSSWADAATSSRNI